MFMFIFQFLWWMTFMHDVVPLSARIRFTRALASALLATNSTYRKKDCYPRLHAKQTIFLFWEIPAFHSQSASSIMALCHVTFESCMSRRTDPWYWQRQQPWNLSNIGARRCSVPILNLFLGSHMELDSGTSEASVTMSGSGAVLYRVRFVVLQQMFYPKEGLLHGMVQEVWPGVLDLGAYELTHGRPSVPISLF